MISRTVQSLRVVALKAALEHAYRHGLPEECDDLHDQLVAAEWLLRRLG